MGSSGSTEASVPKKVIQSVKDYILNVDLNVDFSTGHNGAVNNNAQGNEFNNVSHSFEGNVGFDHGFSNQNEFGNEDDQQDLIGTQIVFNDVRNTNSGRTRGNQRVARGRQNFVGEPKMTERVPEEDVFDSGQDNIENLKEEGFITDDIENPENEEYFDEDPEQFDNERLTDDADSNEDDFIAENDNNEYLDENYVEEEILDNTSPELVENGGDFPVIEPEEVVDTSAEADSTESINEPQGTEKSSNLNFLNSNTFDPVQNVRNDDNQLEEIIESVDAPSDQNNSHSASASTLKLRQRRKQIINSQNGEWELQENGITNDFNSNQNDGRDGRHGRDEDAVYEAEEGEDGEDAFATGQGGDGGDGGDSFTEGFNAGDGGDGGQGGDSIGPRFANAVGLLDNFSSEGSGSRGKGGKGGKAGKVFGRGNRNPLNMKSKSK
jgi:hypothetical protein